jgi:transcriptional regulator GlxA family with amidase domain
MSSHLLRKEYRRIENWEELAERAQFRPSVMADICLISLRQLERFFMQKYNKSPVKWVRELRCRLAREHISKGFANKQVVDLCHFGNESHLCHEFQRVYGASPQSFAQLCRNQLNRNQPAPL